MKIELKKHFFYVVWFKDLKTRFIPKLRRRKYGINISIYLLKYVLRFDLIKKRSFRK